MRIEVRIGPAIQADALRQRSHANRQLIMDGIGQAVAAILPPKYRGVYGNPTP